MSKADCRELCRNADDLQLSQIIGAYDSARTAAVAFGDWTGADVYADLLAVARAELRRRVNGI